MCNYALFQLNAMKFCMWGRIIDIIICTNFFDNWQRGFSATEPAKQRFPYSVFIALTTVSTTVLHCDTIITAHMDVKLYVTATVNMIVLSAAESNKEKILYTRL